MATHGRVEIDLAEVRQLRGGAVYARPFEYPPGVTRSSRDTTASASLAKLGRPQVLRGR